MDGWMDGYSGCIGMAPKKFAFDYKKPVVIIIILLAVISAIYLAFYFPGGKEEFQLVPAEKTVGEAEEEVGERTGTEVGTGWSVHGDPEEAVKEAVTMALEGEINKTPDFAIIFATSGSDMETILTTARGQLGAETKIYGGSSDSRAVMTEKGFAKATADGYYPEEMEGERALAIMTVTSEDIVFGVGSANTSAYPTVQEAAKTAVLNAIRDAGQSEGVLPDIIFVTAPRGWEEETLEGFEEVVGKKTVILGGTAGGPEASVFGKTEVYDKGVSLAVIYTDLPIGWTFEGGFDTTDPHSGVVTAVDGQAILEIDNRPALEVYDEWLNGEIMRLYVEHNDTRVIKDLLTLHPLYRKYTSETGQEYALFSHPWARDPTMVDRAVATSTKIKVGERVYLSHGTWEVLENRVCNLPTKAKISGDVPLDSKPLFSVGYVCAGVMGTIPEDEREKLPILINYANNNAPFIAPFTSGEQGHFPGVGNKHGNLLTSFTIIG